MGKRKLALLLLAPMAMLLVMPFAVQAGVGNTYFMYVECISPSHSSPFASASLVFMGHYIQVICPAGSGFHNSQILFASSAGATFAGATLAGGNFYTVVHYLDATSKYCGAIVETGGPGGTFAEFEMLNSQCG